MDTFHSTSQKKSLFRQSNSILAGYRMTTYMVVTIVSVYFLSDYHYAFNYETDKNGQYLGASFAFTGFFIFLLLGLLLGKPIQNSQKLLMTLVFILMLYVCFSDHFSFSNEYFVNICVAMVICVMLMSANIGLLHSVVITFVIIYFIQLGLAFNQMKGFSFKINRLNIKGSLQNSGVFCCYIVSQLPFLHYFLFGLMPKLIERRTIPLRARTKKFLLPIRVCVSSLISTFVFLIISMSQSRTALLAFAVLMVSFFLLEYKNLLTRLLQKMSSTTIFFIALLIVTATGVAAIYLIHLKQMSAWGRLMMSDIARKHFWEHFWFGTGIGQFTWYYPQWQEQYFAIHSAVPQSYFLSADESYIIFNEYLQLFETVGIFGFLVMLSVFIFFFKSKSNNHPQLLDSVKQTTIVILACCFTSYPLHVNFMLLLVGFCLATASIVNENKNRYFLIPEKFFKSRITNNHFFSSIAILISGYAVFLSFMNHSAKLDWDILRNRLTGSRSELKSEYAKIQSTLRYNSKFQVEYASFLMESNEDVKKAIGILERSQERFISRTSVEALALAYKKNGNIKKTIAHYAWLSNFLPSKFEPKFQLLTLYDKINDTINVRRIGRKIMTMPVKINSSRISSIKTKTSEILNRMK